MAYFDDNLTDMLGALSDFDKSRIGQPDDKGLIEAPLIPLRGLVIFPQMVTPLFVGRKKSLLALEAANDAAGTIICAAQIDPDEEEPDVDGIYAVGVEVVPGLRRVEIVGFSQEEPYNRVKARPIEEQVQATSEIEASMRAVLTLFERCVQLNRHLPEDAYIFAMNIDEPGWLADLIATTLDLPFEERQRLLETSDPPERLLRMSVLLGKELEVLEIEDQIHNRVQEEVDKTQREMILREQMRAIQTELGEADLFQQEVSELRERVEQAALPDMVAEKANKELNRLAAMPPMAPETGIIRTYLDWLLELPWTKATEDHLDLTHAAQVMDDEHFGLEKAKERILEHIAVRKIGRASCRSPILCFVGPPGTGKTSLGRSIARALDREFVRLSLGGVTDEAETRGHRRTYIGALPGRIIQTMRRAGTINPLFMLDEIDKLGHDFRGDPAAALLEVLDPEQNHAFSDHYLEVDYDLSKVMFVTP